ncbi:cyclic GMP-AMP synthase-like [Uloborus diversus]|uniref:cyclic GMP-AMP synthase-like n=1 Tax=Uloborus diversus TaxID=327109 RepID=UPI0024093012|nr:cyclic GMP-AMP synthase-like [Uloborus diversus]
MAEKCLKCNSCNQTISITDEDFPEDLYELMFKYQIKQLSWVCKACYNKSVACCNFCTSLSDNMEKMELDMSQMKDTVKLLFKQVESLTNVSVPSNKENLSSRIQLDSPVTYSTKHSSIESSSSQKSKAASELLQKILKNEIKIDDEEKTNGKKVVNSFLETLRQYLKKNEETYCIFNRFNFTGSSYQDLKISKATEYDINVVLVVSSKFFILEPEFFESTHAYAKIRWEPKDTDISLSIPMQKVNVIKFLKNTSEDYYIVPRKITSWFQSHIDNFLRGNHAFENIIKSVTTRQSGPARTMDVDTIFGYTISIDLAPVFIFPNSYFNDKMEHHFTDIKNPFFYMVPKVYRGDALSERETSIAWRLDFTNTEEHVLHNKLCAKPIIKLLKLLRDKENWRDLASYYIKTVMLWKVNANPSNEYWNNTYIFERLLEVMKLLHNYLQEQHLPFFFYKPHNLIYKMNQLQCQNWSYRLEHIISEIDSDYNNLNTFFCS